MSFCQQMLFYLNSMLNNQLIIKFVLNNQGFHKYGNRLPQFVVLLVRQALYWVNVKGEVTGLASIHR